MADQAQDRRLQILNIALSQFANYGYHRTKISDIVREAGVAQGTFYWYFKSKEAIALEIVENGQEDLIRVISQGYRQVGGTVQEAVLASERLFQDLFVFSEQHKDLMGLLFQKIETEGPVKESVLLTHRKLEAAFENNIKRAMELGILPEKDPTLQSVMLMSLFVGVLSSWLFESDSNSTIKNKTATDMAHELVGFEFFGLLG